VAADVRSAEALPADHATRGESPHRWRFLFVYGTLGAALALALVGVVIYAGRSISPGPTWSAWKPHGGGLGAAKEIAQHVGGGYRLPGGKQLVDVIAKVPSVTAKQTIPINFFSVRGPKGVGDALVPVSSSDSMTFSLCGLGQACSIPTGKSSAARGVLVRREILELALYTFKYVPGVKNVVAFQPPVIGKPQYAVYLQKDDLFQQLKLPLVRTLSATVPLPSTIAPRESQVIDSVLKSRIFTSSFAQSQQGDLLLVLRPFKVKQP
jgi:hypothetical protein